MRLRGGVTAAVVMVFAVAGCKAETTTTGSGGPEETGGASGAALSAAKSLTVKGRAPKTGYDRDRFGTAWADTDSNDCDTRDVGSLVKSFRIPAAAALRPTSRE